MPRRRKKGPRTKTGRLSEAYKSVACDYGTPELRAKRQAMVGETGDPVLSATAVGILRERGYLDNDQYEKAIAYRIVHNAVFGTMWPTHSHAEQSEEKALLMRKRLEYLDRRMTQTERNTLCEVACRDAIPNWFFAIRRNFKPQPEDIQAQDLLISALDALPEITINHKAAA